MTTLEKLRFAPDVLRLAGWYAGGYVVWLYLRFMLGIRDAERQ